MLNMRVKRQLVIQKASIIFFGHVRNNFRMKYELR